MEFCFINETLRTFQRVCPEILAQKSLGLFDILLGLFYICFITETLWTFQRGCHEILKAIMDGEGVGLDRAVAAFVLAPPAHCC